MKNSNGSPFNQVYQVNQTQIEIKTNQRIKAFVLFWTLLAFFCSVPSINAKNIEVCASGACDYTRIQDAIDAEPSDITEITTIEVHAGQYEETVIIGDYWKFNETGYPLTINKNAKHPNRIVNLIGAKKDEKPLWELDRGDDESVIIGQIIINTLGSGVVVNGFTVDGSIVEVPDEDHKIGTSAIMIASGPDAIIKNNIIKNSKRFGIRNGYVNAEGNRVQISNNTIISSKETAILNHVGNNDVIITDNYIDNGNLSDGIASLRYENYLSENIKILNNKLKNGYKGIFLDAGSGALVSGNTIENYTSFAIYTLSQAVIAENTVISCKDGIRTEYAGTGPSDRVEITGNNISNIEYSGINVCGTHTSVSSNTLSRCNIGGGWGTDWDYASIHVEAQGFDASHSIIQNNIVSNGINGIQVWANNVTVTGNTITQFGKSDGGDYSDRKFEVDRWYENSAIIIGTNFGDSQEEIDPINLNIQHHEDTFYSNNLNAYPQISYLSEEKYTILENTLLKGIQCLIEDEDNETVTLELITSNPDLIATSDINITSTNSIQQLEQNKYLITLVDKKSVIFFSMTPQPDKTGMAIISVVVDDSSETFKSRIESQLFSINVEEKKYPPEIINFSDKSVSEGAFFENIILDNYISDNDNNYSEITWNVSLNDNIVVTIIDRIANVAINDSDWYGSETITFTATDPDGLTSKDSIIFTVTPVNDPPIVSVISDQSITEGSSFTSITLDDFIHDIDNEDAEINWTINEQKNLTVTIINRIARISPKDENWNGSEAVIFTATDPGGLTSQKTASFTVLPVNDAPEFLNIPDQSIDEGYSFHSLLLDDYVSDVDNELNDIDFSVSTPNNYNIAIVNHIAIITVKDENWNGSETVVFTVIDPEGLSATDSVAFSVTPVNDAPVVYDILDQTIEEGKTFSDIRLNYFVYDVDNNDEDISWTFSGQENLEIAIEDGSKAVISINNNNWNGTESISFIATDPEGLTSADTAIFTVTAVNDAPEVLDISDQNVLEGQAFQNIVLDNFVSDIDNDKAEILWSTNGQNNLDVSIIDRVATITAKDENWNGSETIYFIATDPEGLTSIDSATFSVTEVNDSPEVSDIPDQTIEEGQLFSDLSLNDYVKDVDNNDSEISWEATGQNKLIVSINDNKATISTNNENWNGSETIKFIATDPEGLTSSDTAIFTVTAVNDAPEISGISDQNVLEGQAFQNIILDDFVSDVDNEKNELLWKANGYSNLEILIINRIASITAVDENWNGSEDIIFTAIDPEGLSSTVTVKFTVTGVNDKPIIADIPNQTIAEGDMFSSLSLDFFVFDFETADEDINWDVSGNINLVVSIQDRTSVVMAKDTNWNGSETISFIATDAGGLSSAESVVFTVTPVNDAPVVEDISNQYAKEGEAFPGINLDDFVSDVDNEKDQIIWVISGNINLNVSIENRIANITSLDENWNGVETLIFTATDPGGLSSVDSAIFTVSAVNDSPEITDIPEQTTEEGLPFSNLILDELVHDIDNDDYDLNWTVSGQKNLKVTIEDRIASITSNDENWNGSETILLTVTDPGDLSSVASVIFTVTPVNDPPQISEIPDQSVNEGNDFQDIILDNYISDVDNSYTEINWAVSEQENLNIEIEDRVAKITALDENWNGSVSLVFTAKDIDGLSNSETVLFTVVAVNDPPEMSDIPNQSVEEGQPFANLTLDYFVSDVDNDETEMEWTFNGQENFNVNISDRIASVSPKDENWNGSEKIIFTVTDPNGLTASDSATFTVTPVNDPPEISEINDVVINEGQDIANISLDNYISDVDNEKTQIIWSVKGQENLNVNIDNRVASIKVNDENWNGSESLVFTAKDPDGLSTSETVIFTVVAVNDPPEITDIPNQSVEEGQAFANLILDDFVSDVDNDESEMQWTFNGQENLNVNISDRIASVSPKDENWNGSEKIIFTVTDPDGLTACDSATFTVTPVNDPPEISDIYDVFINEGQDIANISLDNYISDVDNEKTQIIWSVKGQENLNVNIDNRVASIEVNDENWNGSETLIFIALDPEGLTASESVIFTVNAVNDPPEISDIPGQLAEEGNAFTTLKLNDYVSDIDNDKSEIILTFSDSENLNVNITDNIATISAKDENWNGSETIKFTATDPDGLTATVSVIFTVTPVNDPPSLEINKTITSEGAKITLTSDMIKASDIEDIDGSLTIIIQSLPQNGNIIHNSAAIEEIGYEFEQSEIVAGKIKYKHDTTETESDSFKLKVKDSELAESDEYIFNIEINNINDSPEAINNGITVTENKTVTITQNELYAKDEETDPELLVYTIKTFPKHGTILKNGEAVSLTFTGQDIKDYKLTYAHNGAEESQDSFKLTISDKYHTNSITTAPFTVFVSILPENDLPIVINSEISVLEGESLTITSENLLATDDDEDDPELIVYKITQFPEHGKIYKNDTLIDELSNTFTQADIDANLISYEHDDSEEPASDYFVFKLIDGIYETGVNNFVITIIPVNDPPEVSDLNITITEDDVLKDNLVSTDSESDSLTYNIIMQPTNGKAKITSESSGTFSYTPNLNFNGYDSFTYQVSDGKAMSNIATVTIEVSSINDPPEASDLNKTILEDEVLIDNLVSTDIENDVCEYNIVKQPTNGTVKISSENSGAFAYTPNLNYNGSDSFIYQVSDGLDMSNTATVAIEISPVNDPPIASDSTKTIEEDQILEGYLDSNDPENEVCTYHIVKQADHGTAQISSENNGFFTYTPDMNYFGTDTFTYQVLDESEGLSNIATVTIEISPVNDPPFISEIPNQTIFSDKGQSEPIAITVTDPESDILGISYISSNLTVFPISSFILDAQNKFLTIVPVENVLGQSTVKIKVKDEEGETTSTTFQVSVVSSDTEPPVISIEGDQLITIPEGTTFNANDGVFAYDSVDGDITNYMIIENPLEDNTPPGTYQIKYTVSDYAGNEAIPVFRTVIVYTVEIQTIKPEGNIVDESNDSIGGVMVESNILPYTSLSSDMDGSFIYTDLDITGQVYYLTFSHKDYETVIKKFSGNPPYDSTNLLDIMMLSKESDNSAQLSGVCLDYTNTALEDVQINVFNPENLENPVATTQTNANGMYTITFDQRDISMDFIVKASKYRYVTQEAKLTVPVDKKITSNFYFPKKTILKVKIPITEEEHEKAFNNEIVKVIVEAIPPFDNSPNEFEIQGSIAPSLTTTYSETKYIIQYNDYKSFDLTFKADTTEDKNTVNGYVYTMDIHFTAVPQEVSYTATIDEEIVNAGQSVLLKSDDQKSKTILEIPAKEGFEADVIPEKIDFVIQEFSGYTSVNTAVVGKIVSIDIKDQEGNELGKKEDHDNPLKKILITIEYKEPITSDGILDGTFQIIHAKSAAAIIEKNEFEIISIDKQIIKDRITDDTVTFWVDHLSAFAIQEKVDPVIPPTKELPHPSSNCFIQSTFQDNNSTVYSFILIFGIVLGVCMQIFSKNYRKQFGTLLCFFSFFIVLFFSTTSWAKIQENKVTFSFVSGGLVFEQNKNVGDGPLYGVGIGYHLTPHLGAEFMAIYGKHNVSFWDDIKQEADFEKTGNNLYHLNVHYYFMPEKIFVPYLNLGLSHMDYESDYVLDDADIRINYGLGAKLFLNEIIAFRGDISHIFSFDESSNHLACTFGMTFQLGAKLSEKKKKLKYDNDGDGVVDTRDECPHTPKNVIVNRVGCPKDSDMDGVYDNLDDCPNTPSLAIVDQAGCPKDSDQDGIYDHLDHCINTPRNMNVDSKGCSPDQDGDSVPDYKDKCPNTCEKAPVDKDGCPIDQDGDGVYDNEDQCPKTPSGTRVDKKGCPVITDQDNDGVPDHKDKCLNTKPGTKVNSSGCKPIAKNIIFIPYVVQVSSYSTSAKAHNVAMKYRQKGEDLFTSMIKAVKESVHSIFYGVYRSKHEAEKVVEVLKRRKFRNVRLLNLPYAIYVQPNEVYIDDKTIQKQLNKHGYIAYEIQGDKYGVKQYVGAYPNYKMAQQIANKLSSEGFKVKAEKRFIEVNSEMAKDLPYVFLISAYPDRKKAFEVANNFRNKGDPTFTSYKNNPDTDDDYEIYYGYYQTTEQTKSVSKMLQKRRFKQIELKRKPYAICAGVFNQHNDIKQLETALAEKGYLSYAIPVFDRPDQVKVFVGAFKTKSEANDCLKMMKADGFLPSIRVRSEKRTAKTLVQPYPAFMDTDRDGVSDANDKCADTPPKKEVNSDGCQKKQKNTLLINKHITYPYTIQVSEYSSKMKAYEIIQKFRKKGDPMYMSYMQMPQLEESYGLFYGYYPTFEKVQNAAVQLKQRNFRRVDILNMPYVLQLGVFDNETKMESLEKKLYENGYVPYRLLEKNGQKKVQILIGAYKTIKGAQAFKKMLESDGFNSTILKRAGSPAKIPEVPLDKFKDKDNDGISDEVDKCPGTKDGEIANQEGCSIRQISGQVYKTKKTFLPLLSNTEKKEQYPWTIRISSYMNREAANHVAVKFRQKGDSMYISYAQSKEGTPIHDVFYGFYRNFEEAQMAALELERRRFKSIEMIKMPYAVQVGIFDSYTALVKKENELMTKGYLTYSIPDRKDNSNIRLLLGAYPTEKAADIIVAELKSKGFQPIIVKR